MTVAAGAFGEDLSDEVRTFLEHYFQCSNAASTHTDHEPDEEHFASLFTEDGVYDFVGREAHGKDQIMELRKQLFDLIPHRDHRALKTCSHENDEFDLMAFGDVNWRHESGKEHTHYWAAQYALTMVDNRLKFKSIRIIADTKPEDD